MRINWPRMVFRFRIGGGKNEGMLAMTLELSCNLSVLHCFICVVCKVVSVSDVNKPSKTKIQETNLLTALWAVWNKIIPVRSCTAEEPQSCIAVTSWAVNRWPCHRSQCLEQQGRCSFVPFSVETVSVTQPLTTLAVKVRSRVHVCLMLFLRFAFGLYCIPCGVIILRLE